MHRPETRQATVPSDPSAASLRLMPSIDTLIPRFKAADRTTRLETLLDYSRKLPPLPQRLEEEKAGLTADIREIYAEAKGSGFDTKVMRQIVRLRKMDDAARQEQEALLDVYRRAIGLD